MAEQRPLFDPSRIRVPTPERAPPASGALTPWQVNELIKGALTRSVPASLSVLGELGDVSRSVMGHFYFTLKDDRSELRGVMWRSAAQGMRFEPRAGLQVIAHGGLEIYMPRGALQLVVRRLEPRGVGALELAFRQLREKLEREGLFDARRKRPLPRFPGRIAVVTSPRGAALRDITKALARRFPAIDVVLFPTRVQGDGAAAEIVAAIQLMNRAAPAVDGIDVAIVGRGGGALEDLWPFNEEIVARAIVASAVPVVSAVGHEVDFTIADFVADLRAATPTAAAELTSPDQRELRESLARLTARMQRAVHTATDRAKRRLSALLGREALARPTARLRRHEQRVDEHFNAVRWALAQSIRHSRERVAALEARLKRRGEGVDLSRLRRSLERLAERAQRLLWDRIALERARCGELREALSQRAGAPGRVLARDAERIRQSALRIRHAAAARLRRIEAQLNATAALLAGLDPKSVLRRGFSITRNARTGELLRSTRDVTEALPITTLLADGEFRSYAEDPRQGRLFEKPTP